MSESNGKPSFADVEELTRRIVALEARLERELPVMNKVIETAIGFHAKLNERLDLMQQVLVEVAKPQSQKNGESPRNKNAGNDSLASGDDLDARILALREKLQKPG